MNQINPAAENTVELDNAQKLALNQYLLDGKELFISLPQTNMMPIRAQLLHVIAGQTLLIRPLIKSDQLDIRVKLNGAATLSVRLAVPNGVLCFESKLIPLPQQPQWTIGLQWPEQMRIEQSRHFSRVALHQALLVERTGDMRRRAMLLNLSEQGMQVEYHAALGMIGDELHVSLELPFEDGAISVEASAIIRSKFSEISEDHVLHGLEFCNLTEAANNNIQRYMQQRLSAQNDAVACV
ncbi:PilZ domain-containing protein [Deefgea piscis]|uniref:PilZ domain-containing protein n=1 Tax=Deefgea piscis TaxID=2739061 RepID=UPI001C812932|nr:PilZ domain-containing protein [Deefgea piscis]QZA81465.1 PilZ domain-containing protein [Deefgea piscis]